MALSRLRGRHSGTRIYTWKLLANRDVEQIPENSELLTHGRCFDCLWFLVTELAFDSEALLKTVTEYKFNRIRSDVHD
jgi:hypothetical protein